jgi:hypothetical protein
MSHSVGDGFLEQLEQLGPEHVRTLLTGGHIPEDWDVRFITHWLAEKDFAAERIDPRKLNINSLCEVVARANRKATWALVIAAVALIVTIINSALYLAMIEASRNL